MDPSVRILSLWTTRAVCPMLRRLGALVLQDALSPGVGVAASGAAVGVSSVAGEAGVGVEASVVGGSVAAEVGVGEGASVVGGSVATDVDVGEGAAVVGSSVGGTGDGTMVSVASDARIASVATGDGARVSVWAGASALVAHPRRSIKMRMSARITVTIVLNRS